jgi:pimeloyl-ACP methyl ester carboxylesterase
VTLALATALAAAVSAGSVSVPLDHGDPSVGRGTLRYEIGAAWNPSLPAVLVVADGQQYYLQPGAAAQLQKDVFGPAVNVVAILTRGSTPEFLASARTADGQVDWKKAWRIFRSEQWVEDIDAVRRSLVGPRGQVMLFGRSGGAYLVHQYLMRHGAHVRRAFTQSAVSPTIARALGVSPDRFWEELRAQDPALGDTLRAVLARRPDDHLPILVALQRQHFFVPADGLAAARAGLIRALDAGDAAAFARARKEYQVDEVLRLSQSPEAAPQHVRVLEMLYPMGAFTAETSTAPAVRPLVDSQRVFLQPLLGLLSRGEIPAPAFDLTPAHGLATEVFVLAARWDEAVDHHTLIALAHAYPRHELFLADDNHVFTRLDEAGARAKLIQAFFAGGIGSPALSRALAEAESRRWRP